MHSKLLILIKFCLIKFWFNQLTQCNVKGTYWNCCLQTLETEWLHNKPNFKSQNDQNYLEPSPWYPGLLNQSCSEVIPLKSKKLKIRSIITTSVSLHVACCPEGEDIEVMNPVHMFRISNLFSSWIVHIQVLRRLTQPSPHTSHTKYCLNVISTVVYHIP